MELMQKQRYSLSDFLDIVNTLQKSKRRLYGHVQTHSSVRANLLEEVYEAIEAIDINDNDMLREKLGNILFQIAIHCNIEKERSNFSMEDIIDEMSQKIIMRYPHVFAQTQYKINRNIYDIRDCEKEHTRTRFYPRIQTPAESVRNVSRILPSLMRTTKIQDKAACAGYGVFSVDDAINESFDKLNYLENLIMDGNQEDYSKEIGDLLFCITEIARLINVDAESALYDSCEKFKDEFLYKISLANRKKV